MDATVFYERLMRRRLMLAGGRSRRLPWRGGQLHALDVPGQGELPAVVLLHGFSASGPSQYTTVCRLLRPHVSRVLIPDLPGHGDSSIPPRLDGESMLAGLEHMLEELVDEPAVLFASSMSGALASRYAAEDPTRVAGLILCSPGGAPLAPADLDSLRRLFRIDSREASLAFVDSVFAQRPLLREMVAWGVMRQLNRPHLRAMLARIEDERWLTPRELAGLRMPVQLLWGTGDRILPRRSFDFFREHLPAHARIERPSYGHAPFLEAPGALASSILQFVRHVAAFRSTAVAVKEPSGRRNDHVVSACRPTPSWGSPAADEAVIGVDQAPP